MISNVCWIIQIYLYLCAMIMLLMPGNGPRNWKEWKRVLLFTLYVFVMTALIMALFLWLIDIGVL